MLTKYTQENENDRALIDSQTATPKANATWVPPPQGLATLSVDTTIDPVNNKSSLAGILHNGNWETIAALTIPLPCYGAPQVQEAKALIISLKWFLKENFPIHYIETDCKNIRS
uniref:RNase H type-1 domain-containing protein n=1 Tax=Cannabis sativa TaxID=3483 RepID=A0A803PL47_CANSA